MTVPSRKRRQRRPGPGAGREGPGHSTAGESINKQQHIALERSYIVLTYSNLSGEHQLVTLYRCQVHGVRGPRDTVPPTGAHAHTPTAPAPLPRRRGAPLTSHWKGFSPVCVLLCSSRPRFWLKALLHSEHL